MSTQRSTSKQNGSKQGDVSLKQNSVPGFQIPNNISRREREKHVVLQYLKVLNKRKNAQARKVHCTRFI